MEHQYNIKRTFLILGFSLIIFSIAIFIYITGILKNINKDTFSSIISYVGENAHTGLDKSPGAQILFGEKPETATQYAIIVPKKIEQPAVAMGERPKQLFDINLELDSLSVDKVDDLGLRVVFVSFGTEPTPVDMTFDIIDSSGNIIYSKMESITVETEAVYNKNFVGLILNPGNYTLRLTTLYNTNVQDQFEQQFEIKSAFSWTKFRLYTVIILGIVIISLLFFPKKALFVKAKDQIIN
jgi:hypothetical protein